MEIHLDLYSERASFAGRDLVFQWRASLPPPPTSFSPFPDVESRLPHAGLSKSLGLIEGFGGRGRGGLPATLSPAEESDAKYLREKYGYNAFLSDRISLDRTIPDHRPSK